MTAVLHKLPPSPPSKIPNLLTPTVSEKQNKTKHDLILKTAIDREDTDNIWSPPASRPFTMNRVTTAVDTLAFLQNYYQEKKVRRSHILQAEPELQKKVV